jgi:hypothetical protein
MDKASSILIYSLFIILPWKAALPSFFGDLIASSIDKIIVIMLLVVTYKYWGYILLHKISVIIFFLVSYLFVIFFLMFLHIEQLNMVIQLSDYVFPFLMVFVGLVVFKKDKEVDQFFRIIIIYSAVIAFLGTFEIFNETYREWANEIAVREFASTSLDDVYNRFRARFFFSSFMGFGVYCGVMLLFCIYLMERMQGRMKILYSICSFSLLLGLLASFSRGPWVMFFISLLCYYLIKIYRKELKIERITRVVLVTLVLFVYLSFSVDGLNELLTDRFSSIFNWSSDNSNTTRISRWGESLEYFYRNSITGLGLSATGASGLYTDGKIITESYYIKLAIEGGLTLILYFLLLQIIFVANLFKDLRKRRNASVYLSIFIGFIVYMFIYQILEARIIAYLYWFIVGVAFRKPFKNKSNLATLKLV